MSNPTDVNMQPQPRIPAASDECAPLQSRRGAIKDEDRLDPVEQQPAETTHQLCMLVAEPSLCSKGKLACRYA